MSKCPICGEPTSSYKWNERKDKLCRKHAKEFKEGKIVQCEKCGAWHNSNEECSCQQKKNEKVDNVIVINNENKSKCITCGRKTDGLLFCPSCYQKYKDKSLLFKISNCSNVELLDESYEGRYTSKDGHILKSKSERDIDNYLFDNNISHVYERELSYGSSEKEVLHPDFFLPNYLGKDKHVYIEHWGYNENNIKYIETMKFKIPIYERLCKEERITLICTYEKTDAGKIDTVLERKLKRSNIKEGQINYLN